MQPFFVAKFVGKIVRPPFHIRFIFLYHVFMLGGESFTRNPSLWKLLSFLGRMVRVIAHVCMYLPICMYAHVHGYKPPPLQGLPPCPTLRKEKKNLLSKSIEYSYFAILPIPCRHLSSMPTTSPWFPPPCPPFAPGIPTNFPHLFPLSFFTYLF